MKLALGVALLGLMALASAEPVKYDNYKVYRITPSNEQERKVLLNLEESNPGVMFWKHVRHVGQPVDIMVPPHLQDIVESLEAMKMPMREMVNDVQSLINLEASGSLNASPRLSWDAYYSTEEIYAFLDEKAAAHPSVATVRTYGQSFEGRELKYIYLNKGNTPKRTVFIDANIHAREWITNTIATWTLEQLLDGDDANRAWLDVFNFYIVPVVNPDGYEYSRNSQRLWRKTRSVHPVSACRGADPNRNFNFDWGTGGSSTDPCSDTFRGTARGSEPEVEALQSLLDGLEEEMVFYLSLHSYSQLILIPYGSNKGRTPDHNWHMEVGTATKNAIAQRYRTNFTPGNIVELLYVASGASVDYVKGALDPQVKKLTYTFEMRDTGTYGFVLPPNQITPSCLEFMDGLQVMLNAVRDS